MKYTNFKRYKFSTFFKNINFRRYNFSKIYKYLNFRRYNFFNSLKYSFSKLYKYLNFRRYSFSKIFKYIIFIAHKFSKIDKFISLNKYKYVPIYLVSFLVLVGFIYISAPIFFKYDKLTFKNFLCKDLEIKCKIEGKIKYTFFPTPRIKFKHLTIQDNTSNTKPLAVAEDVEIKVSVQDLLNKKDFKYTKIEFKNVQINLDLENLKKYKIFSKKKFNSQPIILRKSKINFFDEQKNIGTIENVNFKYKPVNDNYEAILKGNFLGEDIYVNLKNEKNKPIIFVLKFLNSKLLTKMNIFNYNSDKNTFDGNILFRQERNRLRATFNYKEGEIIFKEANLRNDFLNGKFDGWIKFLPFFNFDLNVDLNGINFNKFHNFLISLDKKSKENLFKINKKINGQFHLSANKIYSDYELVNSFESRIKLINGNILVEQLLLNLGKIGAADVTGLIKNDKKFTNFKFENNIFIDNEKRFYRKFGIYNQENLSTNLFISGNFDLVNLKMRFHEISNSEKFKEDDVAYVEKEFNEFLLGDGYKSFFNFINLKNFIKLIFMETDLSNKA